jgi:hypothetical protein
VGEGWAWLAYGPALSAGESAQALDLLLADLAAGNTG